VIVAQAEWLTRKEAMRYAGVFYTTLQEWEEKGYITTRKEGDRANSPVLIDKASLDRHLATRQTPGKLSESETRERLAAADALVNELRTALARSETERRELQEQIMGMQEQNQDLLRRVLRLAETAE
jgi:Mg2+ and Co2+ transporter CorA